MIEQKYSLLKEKRLKYIKALIVREMFIATADQNYILDRQAYNMVFMVDFYWLGAHSVEKYLKAALLLNDDTAKDVGHDLEKLWNKACHLFPEFEPSTLVRPPAMFFHWSEESVFDFVKRLGTLGSPDNRYMSVGYHAEIQDLVKLDQLIKKLRSRVLEDDPVSTGNTPYPRDACEQFTTLQMPIKQLPVDLYLARQSPELLDQNFAFSPWSSDKVLVGPQHARGDRKYYLYSLVSSGEPDATEEAAVVGDWMLSNIKLGRPAEQKLKEDVDEWRKKFLVQVSDTGRRDESGE